MKDRHEMQDFWDAVSALLRKHDIFYLRGGYLEIVAHGVTYRSFPNEHSIDWISWEPYGVDAHFSSLTDPHATVKFVSHIQKEES